tara:strand:+ start:1276 stop:1566 length:291 start_codon:yes stop_codon:yes gene_type:complete
MIYVVTMAAIFHVGARVSEEQRERYKAAAEMLNISLSELIVASLDGVSIEIVNKDWKCLCVKVIKNKVGIAKPEEQGVEVLAPEEFWTMLGIKTCS